MPSDSMMSPSNGLEPSSTSGKPAWTGSGHPVLTRMERLENGGVFRYVPQNSDDGWSAFVAVKNYRARTSKKVASIMDDDGSMVVFKSTRDIPVLDIPARIGLLEAFHSLEQDEKFGTMRREKSAAAFTKEVLRYLSYADTRETWEREACADDTEAVVAELGVEPSMFAR
jgi:hypothetical protein